MPSTGSNTARTSKRPRFDKIERLRHRFYEPLVLLAMLNPGTGGNLGQLVSTYSSFPQIKHWQDFLNALAWFCDFLPGGAAVCAVAVQQQSNGFIYWICSHHKLAHTHLIWLLKQLTMMIQLDDSEVTQVMMAGFVEQCIKLGRRRVQHYAKKIRIHLPESTGSAASNKSIDSPEEAFEHIISDESSTELDICMAALALGNVANRSTHRTTESLREITPAELVAHNIMKLQRWHRRADTLIAFAKLHPRFVEQAATAFLPLPEPVSMPKADALTNIQSAFGRMLPASSRIEAKDYAERLSSFGNMDLASRFRTNYEREVRLQSHAEVVLMEHLYRMKASLADHIKYIGCSKPSCYCCALYMRYHPGNFVLRTSHGTAWATWNIPLLEECKDGTSFKHTLEVMNLVIAHLRRDVLAEVDGRFPRSRRPPDSISFYSDVRSEQS